MKVKKFILAVVSVVFAYALLSCDVGLGSAVDTQAPTLNVTYPATLSTVRGQFVFGGTCADDQKVTSVTVRALNSELGKSYGPYAATIAEDAKSWTFSFNKKAEGKDSYNGWEMPDGKYTLEAVARDASGKSSGTGAITIDIDNTEPIFILNSPGTTDIKNPTVSGSSFKITGTIADDHSIKYMRVNVYENEGGRKGKLRKSFIEENIETSGGTSVALFKKEHEVYTELYGDIKNASSIGTKTFFCEIELEDSAYEYNDFKNNASGKTGNVSKKVYLYDSVYKKFQSSSGYGLEAAKIKSIVNETLTEVNGTAAAQIRTEFLNSAAKSSLAFGLNPNANPKYVVQGFDVDSVFDINKTGASSQSISVQVNAGLDGTNVLPKKMCVYVFGPFDSVTEDIVSSIYKDPADYAKNNAASVAVKEENSSYAGSSLATYTFNIKLPKAISPFKTYIVAASGTDADGNDFDNDGTVFAFRGAQTGAAPTLAINTPANSAMFNSSKDLLVAGTVSYEGGIDENNLSLDWEVTITDENDSNKVVKTYSGTRSGCTVNKDGSWSLSIPADDVPAYDADKKNGKVYTYSVKVTATGSNELKAVAERSFHVDSQPPVLSGPEVTKTVKNAEGSDCVNGKINISGGVDENYRKTFTLTVTDSSDSGVKKEFSYNAGQFNSEPIDTTEFKDGANLIITLAAEDKAGNKSEPSVKTIKIDQSTDFPSITPSNYDAGINSAEGVGVKADGIKNLFGTVSNNKLSGTAFDDDGVKTVTVEYREVGTDAYISKNVIENGTSTTAPFTFALPSKEAKYEIKITVTDTEGNANGTYAGSPFYIGVSSGAPALKVDAQSSDYTKKGDVLSVKPKVTSNVATTLTASYTVKRETVTETTTETVTVATGTITPDDKGNVSLTVPATVKDGDVLAITYTATDIFGQSASAVHTYTIDNTAPVLASSYYKLDSLKPMVNKIDPASSSWYKDESLPFVINYYDGGCGVERVEYTFTAAGVTADKAVTGSGIPKKVKANGKEYYQYSAAISGFAVGTNTLVFTAVDAAENKSTSTTLNVRRDNVAPTLRLVSIDGTTYDGNAKLVNGTKDVEFIVEAADAASGIASVKYGNVDGTPVKGQSGQYSFTIAAKSLATMEVNTTATDNAGNTTTTKLFNITLDKDAPVVNITSSLDKDTSTPAVEVNGTIALEGNSSDGSYALTATPVFWYTLTKPTAPVTSTEGEGWTRIFEKGTSNITKESTPTAWKSLPIDTKSKFGTLTDGTHVYVVAAVTDSAQNTGYSPLLDLVVDQNTDRPQIKITSPKSLKDMGKDGTTIWQKNTKVIEGRISDDDGISSLEYSFDNSTWKKVEPNGDSWEIDAKEGENKIYFRVTDTEGTTFTSSKTSGLTAPYITDGTNKFGTADAADSILYVTVDTTPPKIRELKFDTTDTKGTYTGKLEDVSSLSNTIVGGTTKWLKIRAHATDNNGIASVKVLINNREVGKVTKGSDAEGEYYEFADIGLSGLTSGSIDAVVTATDNAGTTSSTTLKINVDNTAPELKVTYPGTDTASKVTSTVTMKGIASDNNAGIKSIEYKMGPISSSKDWTFVTNQISWEIPFESTAKDDPKNIKTYITDSNISEEETPDSALYKVYVSFRVTDNLGNVNEIDGKESGNYILFDKDGGKPIADVIYPETGATVGGSLTIIGTATDDRGVSEVQVQLDVNGDGNFDETDYNIIKTWTASDGTTPSMPGLCETYSADWYITATGTNSWKLLVPTMKIAEKKMSLRARAWDNDKTPQTRGWGKTVNVKIDVESPQIENVALVQYKSGSSGETSVSRTYSSGMYITKPETGKEWYLTGTISSTSLSSITITSDTESVNKIFYEKTDPSVTDSKYTFSVRVPIIGDGKTSATINVSSESGLTTKYPVLFSVDSQAPQMYSTNGSLAEDNTTSLRLMSGGINVGTSNPVVNSNVVYTFGDVVKEEGSGLDYIAFYFKRIPDDTVNGRIRVYNPMFNTDGDNRTDIDTTKTAETAASGDVYINSDGLPVMYMKDAVRSTETSLAHTNISGNPNIRVGGLIKIGGSYVRISAVNGDEVTFAPAKAESFTEAEFVYAQIVDHEITEGPTGNDYENVSNDDGDGMIETLKAEGSKYTWTACIFSDRIPDGPVEIHVVTIDKAGNINRGSIATSIQNKRPRIAKVLLGTDLDHNGTYDFYSDSEIKYEGNVTQATYNNRNFGEFNYYSAVDAYNKAQSSVTLSSETFKVKNGMCILPEFTGGNGTLRYNMSVGEREAKEAQKGTSLTALTTDKTSLKVADRAGTKANIEKHVSSQGGIILTNDELEAHESKTKYFAFTFWDETEETVQGTDSQWALLNIPVIVDVKDDTPPNASFKPFFWNGKGKGNNSLAYDKDGKALGHIELESDLTDELKVSPYGTGPKVSGKIVLRGTASDETLLTGLSVKAASVKAAGTEIASAKYENGVWSSENGLTVTNVRDVDQAGHEVTWELEYETPSAQKDLKLTVTATDGGQNSSAEAEESTAPALDTAAEKRTALYTVDVVPYITNVKTMLSTVGGSSEAAWSTYGRTSTGAYVAGQSWANNSGITGEKSGSAETVTLYGFNLAGGTVESSNGGSATLSTVSDTDNSFKFSVKDFKSGDYTVTVNGIPSINNKNSNDSKGSYTGSDAEQMYNRMPNGTTNNNLTDDFKMNIWDIRYDAATSQGGTLKEAVMRIAPGSDKIGFAFTNGASKFSMGGKKDGNSYQIWQSNYADFNNVSFVYDKNGNSYGTATGLDTYPDGDGDFAGRFTFMSSQWGICNTGAMDDNYWGKNKLRMESIGIKGSKVQGSDQNTCIMDTYRFRSPTLATTMHGNSTSVYLAYYDTFQKQIRFRYGTFKTDAVGQSDNADNNNGFDQFRDQVRANNSGGKSAFDAKNTTYSLIAGKDADTLKDTGNVCIPSNSMASTCVAIDAIEGKTAEDDVVVAAWCTGSGVKFAYKKNPYTDNDADSDSANAGTAGYWSKAVEVFSGACEDVSIKADASGAVHISAYNKAEQSLVYRHIDKDRTTMGDVVTVDSYQIVGSRTQIDVQKEGDYYVPYISYYNPATQKTKLAYLLAGKSGIDYSASGVKSDDTFTGNWEVSVIPTTSDIQEDHTNIGLWKDSYGVRRAVTDIKTSGTTEGSINNDDGKTYGNGTNNPVVGYATVIGIRGFIETAQMR